MSPLPPNGPPVTLQRELLATLLGVAIAFACLLPPFIHLLTGPLGPAIGGFVAGRQCRPGARGRAVIALGLGLGMAAIVGTAALIVSHLDARPPAWFPRDETLVLILLGVAVYAAALAAIGVRFGAASERKPQEESAQPSPGQ